jgi:hypothetical protein
LLSVKSINSESVLVEQLKYLDLNGSGTKKTINGSTETTELKFNPISGETIPLKLNLNPVFGDPKISAKVEFLDAEIFQLKICFKKQVLHLEVGQVA